ncbi:MAG: hypothetical protein ACRDZ8_07915 [Acidimicrobiales bacterium]
MIAAIAIGIGGYLHYDVWHSSYRHLPGRYALVKQLFLVNAGLSVLVLLALIISPARLVAVAGLLLSAGSLVAFALSRGPGLPTLHGSFKETGLTPHEVQFLGQPAALIVLIAEGVAVVLCLGLALRRGSGDVRPRLSFA